MEKMFYKCTICGNIVELIKNGKGIMYCCGKPMDLLKANIEDASHEKHVPVVSLKGTELDVQIGSALHPMTTEHYIQWIMVAQDNRTQRIELSPLNEPKAAFTIEPNEKQITVYAYCNLHGLWKKGGK